MRAIGRLHFNRTAVVSGYGWSETYGIEAGDYATVATYLGLILTARLAILPYEISCVGGLISDTDVKGDSYPLGVSFPQHGTWSAAGIDLPAPPQTCLRLKAFGGVLHRSSRYVHGIPQTQIMAGGAYSPTVGFTAALSAYKSVVVNHTSIMTKIHGAVSPPFYTFTDYTELDLIGLDTHKVGRPFGEPVGRRAVA